VAWKRLADHQWEAIRKQLPLSPPRPKGGRPRASSRKCLEGILWIAWTGAQWAALPECYGARSTVHDRLTVWVEGGVFRQWWDVFLRQLDGRQRLAWQECFVDGTFVMAKKGGALVGPTKRGKGSKLMVVVDGHGTPLGVLVERASPAEVKLLERTLAASYRGRGHRRLRRLIADPGLRQQPAAVVVGHARHRTDHPGAQQQSAGDAPRRTKTPALSPALDRGAHQRLAAVVSPHCSPPRISCGHLHGIGSSRLCDGNAQKGFRMNSNHYPLWRM